MNATRDERRVSGTASSQAEETLRLIARAPAPVGLEERIHAALDRAPRRAHILAWPGTIRPESGWMRNAAAAAIVFVVAGGGWGVYTRVEQSQPAKVIVMPLRIPVTGGFAGAGAVRTPQTLPGPMAPQAAKTGAKASLAQPRTAMNPPAIRKPVSTAPSRPAAARKTSAGAGGTR